MMLFMRTTLTLDEDVAQEAKKASRRLKRPFKKIINQALRLGLKKIDQPVSKKVYKTHTHPLNLRKPYQLDNIQELIAQIEGENAH